MAQRSGTHRRPGAVAIGGDKPNKGLGWLKWLLGLLLLALLILLLVLLLSGGKDDKGGAATKSATATAVPTVAGTATTTPDVSGAGSGSLTSAGKTLTPGDSAALTAAVGSRAVGKGLEVVAVDAGRGFWVGTSKAQRTFVEYGSAVGATETQTYKATVGDVVDFRGPVRPAPADPASTLKLNAADAKQLSADGAYVNATTVTKR